MFGVINDVVTLAGYFRRDDSITGLTVDIDLSDATALRATLVKSRTLGAEVYVQQVLFNEGIFPENEDLSSGRSTWRLPI